MGERGMMDGVRPPSSQVRLCVAQLTVRFVSHERSTTEEQTREAQLDDRLGLMTSTWAQKHDGELAMMRRWGRGRNGKSRTGKARRVTMRDGDGQLRPALGSGGW